VLWYVNINFYITLSAFKTRETWGPRVLPWADRCRTFSAQTSCFKKTSN